MKISPSFDLFFTLQFIVNKAANAIVRDATYKLEAAVLSQSNDQPEYLLSAIFGTYEAPCDPHKN